MGLSIGTHTVLRLWKNKEFCCDLAEWFWSQKGLSQFSLFYILSLFYGLIDAISALVPKILMARLML